MRVALLAFRLLCLPLLVLPLLAAPSAARAAPDLCTAAAAAIEPSLRGLKIGAAPGEAYQGPSIRNALAKRPAAGLDFGADFDDKTLRRFPLSANDRFLFKDSVRHIFRAGGAKGLVMLDAEAGTAHCHTPFLFDLSAGAPKAVAAPDPADPYDLCAFGGVALGAVGGSPFYLQRTDDFAETDQLKLFPLQGEGFGPACLIEAHYAVEDRTAETFCAQPALCGDFSARIAQWAHMFRRGGTIADPALATKATPDLPVDDPAALPTFGGASKLVPEPFRFDGGERFYALKGDERADELRIGGAYQGPANMARWTSYRLATLYKDGQPVASFVVERRRGAFQSLSHSQ